MIDKSTRILLIAILLITAISLLPQTPGAKTNSDDNNTGKPASMRAKTYQHKEPGPAGATESDDIEELYRLGAGDKLKIITFGEEDLSGEFEIEGSGSISFPLIGEVKAGGKTLREFEKLLSNSLEEGYLINPKVSIEIINFRPFFIMGEVNKPGSYPYVNSMNVLNAIALAGGYTHRARKSSAIIMRNINDKIEEIDVKETTKVLPGDTIKIEERLF